MGRYDSLAFALFNLTLFGLGAFMGWAVGEGMGRDEILRTQCEAAGHTYQRIDGKSVCVSSLVTVEPK